MTSTTRSRSAALLSWLEEFDRVSIRILKQDLLAARSDFHLVAKTESGRLQLLDPGREVGNFKNDSIPAPRLLAMSIGHRTGTGCARTAEDEFEMAARDLGEGGQMLVVELEAEPLRIELRGAADVLDLIADAPKAADKVPCGT